jgi:ribosome-binding factor A
MSVVLLLQSYVLPWVLLQVVAGAVCPERKRGFDGALSALASITDVYVSNDLQVRLLNMSL